MILDHPMILRLGCALVHFIWQGTLIAGILAVLLSLVVTYVSTERIAAEGAVPRTVQRDAEQEVVVNVPHEGVDVRARLSTGAEVVADAHQIVGQWSDLPLPQGATTSMMQGGNISWESQTPVFLHVEAVQKLGPNAPLKTVLDGWSDKPSTKYDLEVKSWKTDQPGNGFVYGDNRVYRKLSFKYLRYDREVVVESGTEHTRIHDTGAGYQINPWIPSETGNHRERAAWASRTMRLRIGQPALLYELADPQSPDNVFFRLTICLSQSRRTAALTGVVTDEGGKPLENVTVKMCGVETFRDDRWHGNRRPDCLVPRPTTSDKNGRFVVEFTEAAFDMPFDETKTRVNLWFSKDGYAPTHLPQVFPRREDAKVILRRGFQVSGTVKRRENGQLVPVQGAEVYLQCSAGDLTHQKRVHEDPYFFLLQMKDAKEGCDLPFRQRVVTDAEGRYTVTVSSPPRDKKWYLFCSDQAIELEVKEGQPPRGPDFLVAEQIGEPIAEDDRQQAPRQTITQLDLRVANGQSKSVTVTLGQTASQVVDLCRPARPYADDDPWLAYEAAGGGSYLLLFTAEGTVEEMHGKLDPGRDKLYAVIRYPNNSKEEGDFLLPETLYDTTAGDFVTLRVRLSPEKATAATVVLGMRSADVIVLFAPARDLVEDERVIVLEANDSGGRYLLNFSENVGELSEVVCQPGNAAEPFYMLPRGKRGVRVSDDDRSRLSDSATGH